MAMVKKIFQKNAHIFVLISVCIFFTVMTSSFMTLRNIINVLRQGSMLAIAACGGAMIIMTGGLDLSVGSSMSISGMVTAWSLMNLGGNIALSIMIGVFTGFLCGMFNGLLVVKLGLKPFVASLGTRTVYLGLSYIICKGFPIFGFPRSFAFLGQGFVFGVPVPVIIMTIIIIVCSIFCNKTYWGRYIYALGGNEEAARLSGIDINKVRFVVFGISGILAGIAGVIMCSRVNSGVASSGAGYESDVITASLIGGVTLRGGEGKISGVFVGVLTIAVLANGMVLLNLDEYYQQVIKGMILLFAVIADVMFRKRKEKRLLSSEEHTLAHQMPHKGRKTGSRDGE